MGLLIVAILAVVPAFLLVPLLVWTGRLRRVAGAPMFVTRIAYALLALASLASLFGTVGSVRAVTATVPVTFEGGSQKARLVAQGISEAMNCDALVGIIAVAAALWLLFATWRWYPRGHEVPAMASTKSGPPPATTTSDGYAAPVIPVGPTVPAPSTSVPQPSGAAKPSALADIALSVPLLSGSLVAQESGGSGGGAPPLHGAGGGASPPPPPKSYAEEVRERASRLTSDLSAPLEDWFKAATSLVADLRAETATGKKADPAAHKAAAWLAVRETLEILLARGNAAHTQAWIEEVCLAWWDAMTEIQAAVGLPAGDCYRAMPAYILARHKLAGGDRGAALRWAALAHVADKLGGHSGGGGAEIVLKFGLGVPAGIVALLEETAKTELVATKGDWKHPGAFPEMVLTKALALPGTASLVAPTLGASSHPCHPFVRTLIPWIDDPLAKGEDKGARLEWVVAYLAGTLPGARAQRGFNAMGFACEQDVVVVQVGNNTYAFPGSADAILIECKNWESEAGSPQVGYFLARMKYVGATLGILVAKSDITGTKDTDAQYAFKFLQGFCAREGVVCLVVNGHDMRALAKSGTFAELLEQRFRAVTYGNLAKK